MTPIKYRNMGMQILLMIVTFGVYSIYWFYQTGTELKAVAGDKEASPGVWTILLFIPLANIYAWYMYSELFSKVGTEKVNKWILLILALCFAPAIWFLVQMDLNRWSRQGQPTGTTALA